MPGSQALDVPLSLASALVTPPFGPEHAHGTSPGRLLDSGRVRNYSWQLKLESTGRNLMTKDQVASAAPDGHDHAPEPLRAAPLPFAFGRMGRTQRGIVTTLSDVVRQAEQAELRLDRWVVQARAHGISWAVIGTVCGLTGEGARKRWGSLTSDDSTTGTR